MRLTTAKRLAVTTAIVTIIVVTTTTTITPVLSDDGGEAETTASTTTAAAAATAASGHAHAHAHAHPHDDEHWPLYMYQVADEDVVESYEEFMFGCYYQKVDTNTRSKDATSAYYGDGSEIISSQVIERCDEYENDRLIRNEYQPPSMIENFTETGFMKVPISTTPQSHQTTTAGGVVIDKLRNFFRRNKELGVWDEHWNVGTVFANVWTKPTMLLDIGRKEYHLLCPKCQTLTRDDKLSIVSSIQRVAESSLNTRLVPTGVHGIRCYQSGHIIQPTVNRLPHVITAILHIGQAGIIDDDNDGGDWPLEVLSHDRTYHNVTQSKNGREMILIEGASIIHGRPYPLGGKDGYYCELMVHFEPLGYSARHELHYKQLKQRQYKRINKKVPSTFNSAKHAFDKALSAQDSKESSGSSSTSRPSVPEYVWPSLASAYRQQTTVFESEEGIYPKPTKVIFGQISSHTAASLGDLATLKELAKTNRNELFKADSNGWRPIHEAARSGHADVLEYLIEEGAEINERTNHGKGGNPLFWAQKEKVKNAKAIAVLKKHGAVNIPPTVK
mmetsp:Transcript_49439/g.119949  ORF Transcript_49439/g.119949 Transcript_49439/m.119949 type:complete len:559 (-) Transcript_49439:1497-3173(-)